jgi:hypothetical protein
MLNLGVCYTALARFRIHYPAAIDKNGTVYYYYYYFFMHVIFVTQLDPEERNSGESITEAISKAFKKSFTFYEKSYRLSGENVQIMVR